MAFPRVPKQQANRKVLGGQSDGVSGPNPSKTLENSWTWLAFERPKSLVALKLKQCFFRILCPKKSTVGPIEFAPRSPSEWGKTEVWTYFVTSSFLRGLVYVDSDRGRHFSDRGRRGALCIGSWPRREPCSRPGEVEQAKKPIPKKRATDRVPVQVSQPLLDCMTNSCTEIRPTRVKPGLQTEVTSRITVIPNHSTLFTLRIQAPSVTHSVWSFEGPFSPGVGPKPRILRVYIPLK